MTPQHVVDAMQVIAAYLRRAGYAECQVVASGGGAFRRESQAAELLKAWGVERDELCTALDNLVSAVDRAARASDTYHATSIVDTPRAGLEAILAEVEDSAVVLVRRNEEARALVRKTLED